MPLYFHGLADRSNQALGESGGIVWALERAGQHGEFVATQPGRAFMFPLCVVDPYRDFLENRIAHAVSERIVDDLEVVEVEAQHCHGFTATYAGFRHSHFFGKQRAIGQIGQGIVAGQVVNACLGPPLLGDVLMGFDPATIFHWLMHQRNDLAILELANIHAALSISNRLHATLKKGHGPILGTHAVLEAIIENVCQQGSGLLQALGKIIKHGVIGVADNQLVICIDHAQPVGHIVDGGFEANRLSGQIGFTFGKCRQMIVRIGDVLVSNHPARPMPTSIGGADRTITKMLLILNGCLATLLPFEAAQHGFVKFVDAVAEIISGIDYRPAAIAERHARCKRVRWQTECPGVAGIEQFERQIFAPDAQPIGHGLQSRIHRMRIAHPLAIRHPLVPQTVPKTGRASWDAPLKQE